jgi:hypothetical protein
MPIAMATPSLRALESTSHCADYLCVAQRHTDNLHIEMWYSNALCGLEFGHCVGLKAKTRSSVTCKDYPSYYRVTKEALELSSAKSNAEPTMPILRMPTFEELRNGGQDLERTGSGMDRQVEQLSITTWR